VPKKLFRPPAHLVEQWPEVFDDMPMNSMPLAYLNSIEIEFADGRLWSISIKEMLQNRSVDDVVENLLSILDDLDIKNVEFDVDVERLKTDIDYQIKGLI
jgi:hypothetical protein